MNYFFDDTLDKDYIWYRFEWQSRSAIHVHGVVKLKNNPGLCKLVKIAYIGQLKEYAVANNQDYIITETSTLIIAKGKESEEIVLRYNDFLVSWYNSRLDTGFDGIIPLPHPSSQVHL